MEGFSYPCGARNPKELRLTQVLTSVQNSDGSCSIQPVIIERLSNPLIGIDFDEFSIKKMLQNGISIKSLAIKSDHRLDGLENEIEEFNDRLSEYASELFNVKSE